MTFSKKTLRRLALVSAVLLAACGGSASDDTDGSGGASSGGGSSGGGSGADGAALYAARCASCHRALATSEYRGATATQIVQKHGSLVSASEAAAIAAALAP